MNVKGKLERLDRLQQRKPALAIPIATVKKFSEDKSTNMASMMAFWAFFSIFPLLMALVTVLEFVLPDADKQRVLGHVATYFPLLDVRTIGGLSGSWLALVLGLAAALWSGSAVVRVTQYAFNSVWEVPQVERPKMVEQVKRSLLALVTIGVGLLASTLLIGFLAGDNPAIDLGPLSRVLGFSLAIGFDIALFIAAFRLLTDRDISTRDVLPGAVFSGVSFWLLQSLSSVIITRHLNGAQATYGTFATVITILWWFYLQSQLTLFGAQVNVVLKERYHPRGLVDAPDTEADHRLLQAYAREQTYVEGQQVHSKVSTEPGDAEREADATDAADGPRGADRGSSGRGADTERRGAGDAEDGSGHHSADGSADGSAEGPEDDDIWSKMPSGTGTRR